MNPSHPLLLSKQEIISWALSESTRIASIGEPLSADEIVVALQMGVSKPELIRVQMVESLPVPESEQFRHYCKLAGFDIDLMEGMTLGYGINLRKGCRTRKLLSHECRHVHQYEEAGSIELFLNEYLNQVATYSYEFAPLELDAYKFQLV